MRQTRVNYQMKHPMSAGNTIVDIPATANIRYGNNRGPSDQVNGCHFEAHKMQYPNARPSNSESWTLK